MDQVKLLLSAPNASVDYDDGADVLYIAIGEPRPAETVELGDGTLLRIDPKTGEVIGLTLIGLKHRYAAELAAAA